MAEAAENTNIRVVCRIRPSLAKESTKGRICVNIVDNKMVELEGDTYEFDEVMSLKVSQTQVYDAVAKPLVEAALKGYNGSILAYGQTSAGKTYTLEGNPSSLETSGLIPRFADELFSSIYGSEANCNYIVKVSYVEIYNDKINDRLDRTKVNLTIGEGKGKLAVVRGASERYVTSVDEVCKCLHDGRPSRQSIKPNEHQKSQTHSLFSITIISQDLTSQRSMCSKIVFVDLAGNEKVSNVTTGGLLDDTKAVDNAITTLSSVISALAEKQPAVPYRDSKLTRLLKESFGGNSKTVIVVCGSPMNYNIVETKEALLICSRARSIKNAPELNAYFTPEEWESHCESLVVKYKRLRQAFLNASAELKKWHGGEKVAENERANLADIQKELTNTSENVIEMNASLKQKKKSKSSNRRTCYKVPTAEEVDALYIELRDKDEEISALSKENSQLKLALSKFKEEHQNLKKERDAFENQRNTYLKQLQTRKKEIKEAFHVLEDMAMNYETSVSESRKKQEEFEKTRDQLQRAKNTIAEKEALFKTTVSQMNGERKQWTILMTGLLQELGDVGEALNPSLGRPQRMREPTFESEGMAFRLYIHKMKTDSTNIQKRFLDAEKARMTAENELKDIQPKLKAAESKIKELTTKCEVVQEQVKNAIQAKRDAEDKLVYIIAEKSKSDAALLIIKGKKEEPSADEKTRIHAAVERATGLLKDEAKRFQDSCEKKREEILQLKGEITQLNQELEKVNKEKSVVMAELRENNKRLDVLQNQVDRREEAKQELKSLESSVVKELETLHAIRVKFMDDLRFRLVKARLPNGMSKTSTEDDKRSEDGEGSGMLSQADSYKKRYTILQQKYNEMQGDNDMLEKRLKASTDRVMLLENAFNDLKLAAMSERRRYQAEIYKVKEMLKRCRLQANASIGKAIQLSATKSTGKEEVRLQG